MDEYAEFPENSGLTSVAKKHKQKNKERTKPS
jgi:hypothetical protein